MRSQLLGGRGAVRDGHRKRRGAPVRNVQAHAWQQRTRGTGRGHECGVQCGVHFSRSGQVVHGTKFCGVVGVQSWGGLAKPNGYLSKYSHTHMQLVIWSESEACSDSLPLLRTLSVQGQLPPPH